MSWTRSQPILMACPLVICGLIAVSSRYSKLPYQIPSGRPVDDARVMAYAGFVKATRRLFRVRSGKMDRMEILRLASSWDEGVHSGRLQPLIPVSLEDSPQEGERSRILRAKSRLVAFLVEDGRDLAESEDFNRGAQEVLLAMRLSESLKYSNLASVYSSNLEEAKQIRLLDIWSSKLDTRTARAVHEQLNNVAGATSKLGDVLRRTHSQYCEWKTRMNQPLTPADVHESTLVASQMETGVTSRLTIGREINQPDINDNLIDILIATKLAWHSVESEWAPAAAVAR